MNTPENFSWQEVPSERQADWDDIFENAYINKVQLKIDDPCPVCLKKELYHYYEHGLWQWCLGCITFAHYSARDPEWYKTKIDHSKYCLTIYPDALVWALKDDS